MSEQTFELRLEAALGADAELAVRPIDAVSIAVGAVAASRRRGRVAPSLRLALAFALVAATAVAGLVVLAGALRDDNSIVTETRSPIGLDEDGWLLGASAWTADLEPIAGLDVAGHAHLVINYGGSSSIAIWDATDRSSLASRIETGASPKDLLFVLIRNGGGCRAGDVGTYRAFPTSDGLSVDLEVVADACQSRSIAFARRWARTVRLVSNGGTGLVDVFQPNLQITLPPGRWDGTGTYAGGMDLSSEELGLKTHFFRNPQGLTEPCTDDGGDEVAIEGRSAAFAAYIDGLPGVSVQTRPASFAGYPGLRITATWTLAPECSATQRMVAWRTDSVEFHKISGGLPGRDEILAIDFPGGLLLVGESPGMESILATVKVLATSPAATGPP